jgi:hypothetical protein
MAERTIDISADAPIYTNVVRVSPDNAVQHLHNNDIAYMVYGQWKGKTEALLKCMREDLKTDARIRAQDPSKLSMFLFVAETKASVNDAMCMKDSSKIDDDKNAHLRIIPVDANVEWADYESLSRSVRGLDAYDNLYLYFDDVKHETGRAIRSQCLLPLMECDIKPKIRCASRDIDRNTTKLLNILKAATAPPDPLRTDTNSPTFEICTEETCVKNQ